MAAEKEQQQHTDLKKLASFKRTLITVREIMKESDQVGQKITEEERFGQLLNNRDNSSSAPLSSASALTSSSSSQPKRNVEKKKKSRS